MHFPAPFLVLLSLPLLATASSCKYTASERQQLDIYNVVLNPITKGRCKADLHRLGEALEQGGCNIDYPQTFKCHGPTKGSGKFYFPFDTCGDFPDLVEQIFGVELDCTQH